MGKGLLAASAVILLSISIMACDALKDSEDAASYPRKVENLAARLGDGSVVLSWSDPDDADFKSVEISGDGFSTISVVKGVETATISGLINGIAYTFTVKAVASSGEKNSGTVTHAAPFGNVADLIAASGNSQVTLNYASPKASGYAGVEIGGTGINSFVVGYDNVAWGSTTVSGLKNGENATFTAKIIDAYGNRQAAGASVTIVPGMALNSTGVSSLLVGATKTLTATIDGLAVTPTWTSANTSVATVDSSGVVTGVSVGLTRITATSGVFSASCGIAVMSQVGSTFTFSTTPADPDPVFGYNQATSIQAASGIDLPVSVTCAKSSGSPQSYYGIEVRQLVMTDVVRYRLEIQSSGMYRVRRSVTNQPAIILVPWTSSTAINGGLASNVLQVSQPSVGSIRFAVNGTTLQTLSEPYQIDFNATSSTILLLRAALASSYNLDYSEVVKETVAFTY